MSIQVKKQEYVSKFTERVLVDIASRYHVSRDESIRMLEGSSYNDLLEIDIGLVMHYPPSYWAKKVYEEANLITI